MFLNCVNGADVGMIERGSSLGLALKPFQGFPVLGGVFRQELQGDSTLELGVLGLIDDTHAPATEFLNNAIVRNGLVSHARYQPLHAILGRACS